MAKSNKTTWGGVVFALSLLLNALNDVMNGAPIGIEQITLIVAAISGAWQGFMSRDHDVSSEGVKIPKIKTNGVALPSFIGITIAALALGFLVSCGTPGVVVGDNVDPTIDTLTLRTEVYILADDSLTSQQKEDALTDVFTLREYWDDGDAPIGPIFDIAQSVLDRHDGYIEGDTLLKDFDRKLADYESRALRGAFDEANQRNR